MNVNVNINMKMNRNMNMSRSMNMNVNMNIMDMGIFERKIFKTESGSVQYFDEFCWNCYRVHIVNK
jgi:hypothetical protein